MTDCLTLMTPTRLWPSEFVAFHTELVALMVVVYIGSRAISDGCLDLGAGNLDKVGGCCQVSQYITV